MNTAGSSRGSSNRLQITYEDDLLEILAGLGPEGTNQFREYYEQGNHQGRQMTDHEVAMSMLLHDARDLEAIEEDRALALALARDLHLEDEVATPAVEVTIRSQPNPPQPRNNPATAVNPTRPGDSTADGTQTWGDWFASIFNGLFVGPQTNSSTTTAATPVTHIPQGPPPATAPARPTGHVCVICQDPVHGSEIRAPCGHYYDIPCITDLFQSATRDESLYPPRCCRQDIPLSQVQPHLSRDLLTQFQEKSREFGTLNRVYCARQTCSRFLGPLTETMFGVKVYDCSAPDCGTRTCANCRGQYDGWMHTCRQDQGAEHVLNLGRTEGWARCPGCSQLIELNMGCYHMTCRCRTEFCYVCSARWKTCRCPQWDERRLLATAEQRVDAQLGGGDRHHRWRNVQWDEPVVPVEPIRPRFENIPVIPVVQPRVQPVQAVQPRAPHTVPAPRPRALVATPAVRPAVPPRAPDVVQQVLPTPPVQPRAPIPVRRHQTQALNFGTVQSAAIPTQHQSHARSHVPAVQATQSPQSSTSTSATLPSPHSRTRPAVPLKPASLTSTTTLPQPSPVVPPKPASLTPTRSSGSRSSIREPVDGHKTKRSRSYQDTNQRAAGTDARTADTGSTPTSNVGTQNDTIRQRMIREMAERLRVDHHCEHIKWKYRQGGGRCENCHNALPMYLFRCLGCEMLACNRCRRNRL